MRKVVFDIETSNIFQDVNSNKPEDLDISVVGIYDSGSHSYKAFEVEEFSELWPILENANMLVSFNGEHFDLPLLNKYYAGDLFKIKHIDLLKEIQNSVGRRMKLDQLAEGTLNCKKSGHGLEATRLWKEGKKEEVKKYCLDDVKITKDLYDYALKNSKLFFKEGPHINEIKLDVSSWESSATPSAMNYTLPF